LDLGGKGRGETRSPKISKNEKEERFGGGVDILTACDRKRAKN